MPPGRRRTIPGTREGTETQLTADVGCDRGVIRSLAASAVATHLSGTLPVRPGRDRARPTVATRSLADYAITPAVPTGVDSVIEGAS